ncbi:MAG: integron integrase [Gammaproteobacteria bacterium]|nr:integron integrase [Gammaproteobacteria bacterium]
MGNMPTFRPQSDLKLLDQVRQVLRYYHYAYKTEKAYVQWIVRYIRFHNNKHPKTLSTTDIELFLSDLSLKQSVAISTQNQAFNALLFLYNKVLFISLDGKIQAVRSKKKPKVPTVLSKNETKDFFVHISGTHALMAKLLFGSGLRLMECVRLRVKDIDFAHKRLHILGKGNKWRSTILSESVIPELKVQVEKVRVSHQKEVESGFGDVYMPDALARKYKNASKEIQWQYVFPAKKRSTDPRTGSVRKHHVMESGLQKAVKTAARKANIDKQVTTHTMRHTFATRMLEIGVNIRVLQELLGHADVKTTEIYTHVMDKDISNISSPLEELGI